MKTFFLSCLVIGATYIICSKNKVVNSAFTTTSTLQSSRDKSMAQPLADPSSQNTPIQNTPQ